MKHFFTSDLHFFHHNIIKYCNRPFKDVDHMTESLIYNWNSVINKNDIVYILGDFSMASLDKIINVLQRLNGRKILIKGNHDKYCKKEEFKKEFEAIYDVLEISLNGRFIILSHYPYYSWNGQYHGSLHFYGHIHDNVTGIPNSYNVGVENNNYTPIELNEILYKLEEMNEIKGENYEDNKNCG